MSYAPMAVELNQYVAESRIVILLVSIAFGCARQPQVLGGPPASEVRTSQPPSSVAHAPPPGPHPSASPSPAVGPPQPVVVDRESERRAAKERYEQELGVRKAAAASQSSSALARQFVELSKTWPSSDPIQAAANLSVLEDRIGQGDGDAAYCHGFISYSSCVALKSRDVSELKTAADSMCERAVEKMRFASSTGDPRAMKVLAELYEKGFGVPTSRLLAAEWYLNASRRYHADGQRDRAFEALELAMAADPDYPAAKKFKHQLMKP